MFATAPTEAMEKVLLTASVEPLDQGQTLFDEGETSRDVYFILEGKVRIYCYSQADRDVVLVDIEAGGVFGELAALDGQCMRRSNTGPLRRSHNVAAGGVKFRHFCAFDPIGVGRRKDVLSGSLPTGQACLPS